jgi:surfactin synthase thioesterase subunit
LQIIMRLLCGAGGEPPANENREEQSNMTNETVIMLIEAKIQPQRRTELVEAARQYLPLVRAEPGVEAFTSRREKTTPIHLFSTRFTGRKQHRISICSRTSLRNSWRR